MNEVRLPAGSFVRLKTDPTRAGIVREGERNQAGLRMLPVQVQDGSVKWWPDSALELITGEAAPLEERFAGGRFAGPEWLRRTLARLRVTGRLSEIVYSMEATETDFYAFQFKPVLKLLNSPTDGLLIADEVGLGKTIEAGLIWTELRARFSSNRLLVLCPKTLCDKWRTELRRRFGVEAHIIDAAELTRLLASSNPGRGFAAIAGMQSLRPPRGWDVPPEEGEAANDTARAKLARMLEVAADGEPLVDLLIIDEAHHMRNPETLLHRLARLLNEISAHRVFLSATPIHLRNRDLHSLLQLIDPDTFQFEQTLDDLIDVNAPVIRARDLLLRPGVPLSEIRACLDEAAGHAILGESRSLALIRERVAGDAPIDNHARAELAASLEQVNQLANYVTRTRRRDVEEFRVRRDPKAPHLEMHALEHEFYDAITGEVRDYADEQGTGDGFLLSMPQRLLSSSPAAASHYWEGLAGDDPGDEDEIDADLLDEVADGRPLLARLSRLSRRLELSSRLAAVDTKYRLLTEQLDKLWRDEPEAKIIVFSSFRVTLHYLHERLSRDGIASELLHGSIREPRGTILARFEKAEGRTVLLSSEVGSEGVDLQFCWIVVNYDLPWNPMRLEQRIGRVDRLGQAKEKIVIVNLVYAATIDEKIYNRLYRRLGLGQRALGEFEAVLGEPIREMTRKLLDPHLTDEEKQAAIDFAAQAVENLKGEEDRLEADAGSLIRHGDYILEAIAESRELNRWLKAEDILVYVRDRLRRSFESCLIEASPPGSETYRITLPTAAAEQFARFLGRKGLRGQTRLLSGNEQARYRFTASVVKKGTGNEEYISQVHPLVRFAAELDLEAQETGLAEPVAVRVGKGDLLIPLEAGVYAIGIRRWLARAAAGATMTTSRLAYAGASLDGARALTPEEAEALTLAASELGAALPNAGRDSRLSGAVRLLRDTVQAELDARFDNFFQQVRAQVEDRAAIRRQALLRHRDEKLVRLNEEIDKRLESSRNYRRRGEEAKSRRAQSMAEVTRGKIGKLKQACDDRLKEIEAGRAVMPEMEDIAAMFVEIAG
jgi:superfamily II DNA or RNA helicase